MASALFPLHPLTFLLYVWTSICIPSFFWQILVRFHDKKQGRISKFTLKARDLFHFLLAYTICIALSLGNLATFVPEFSSKLCLFISQICVRRLWSFPRRILSCPQVLDPRFHLYSNFFVGVLYTNVRTLERFCRILFLQAAARILLFERLLIHVWFSTCKLVLAFFTRMCGRFGKFLRELVQCFSHLFVN